MIARRDSCRAAIDRVELFKVLTDDEREQLAERLVPTPFSAGEVMTRQGAVAHWLYILASGTCEVRRRNDAGVEHAVAEIEAPAFFGEMGLMTGEPRSANVVATTPCECFRLDKASFEAIIRERPELTEALSAVLARRRVQLAMAQEGGDSSMSERVIVEEAAKLVRRVRSFFGLEEN
jgi:CRP-like cAMP-binding protein